MNNMTFDNTFLDSDIVKSFMANYNFPNELKIKIIITNDMEAEYKNQLSRLNKQYDYISPIDYNGITCVPNTIDQDTIILINSDIVIDYKVNNCEVICTIFHELIHAKDYYNYAKKYCNGAYDSSQNRDALYGVANWSEFNAKRISYLEYCKLIHGEKINSNEELDNIEKNELHVKNKELEDLLKNENSDMEDIIYGLMFYLGRYSVWEKLFPKEFDKNSKFPEELIKYSPLVGELYNALKNASDEIEDYIKIKKLINYFKGAWVNTQSMRD